MVLWSLGIADRTRELTLIYHKCIPPFFPRSSQPENVIVFRDRLYSICKARGKISLKGPECSCKRDCCSTEISHTHPAQTETKQAVAAEHLLYYCILKISALSPLPDAANAIGMGTVGKNTKETFFRQGLLRDFVHADATYHILTVFYHSSSCRSHTTSCLKG